MTGFRMKEDDYLAHYGILRRSGRYPWGSGGPEANTGPKSFLDYVEALHKSGMSEVEVAKMIGAEGDRVTTTQLRAAKSIAKNEQKQADINMAERLRAKGLSNVAIGEKMNLNESSVRALLAPGAKDRAQITDSTTSMLKDQLETKPYLDVGKGTEYSMGITRTRLDIAVAALQEEGYNKYYVKIPQLGTGHDTTHKIITKPGVSYSEVIKNKDKISQVGSFSEDGGRTHFGILPPMNISSSRVGINWKEDGGASADGVIYVRPGVHDTTLGGARYAQVRVAVDGTHYIKGMAMYKDDLPDGIDLQFNTNKSRSSNKLDALKPLKRTKEGEVDQDNPFGAVVRQLHHVDEHGNTDKTKLRSVMNLVNEEGDWNNWSRTLSTQFLSKQSHVLAETQLNMAYERRKQNLDEIRALTNPTVRKKLLEEFGKDTDSASVKLQAAALPRMQGHHVILPLTGKNIKETEVYAPKYRNGERVVLIRHPHAGPFEIPELTVNNNIPEGKRLIGKQAKDAIGIHPKVAERLSGADFDGDTVLVIPNNNRQIKTKSALQGLKGFDAKASYPAYEGMPKMTAQQKQHQMGLVSNLITDMHLRGANDTELAAAVRHSMVVIDAEKHNLDWKSSARDNGIPALMKKYQNSAQGGASTLISKAKSDVRVNERKQGFRVDPATGKKIFTETGNVRVYPEHTKIGKRGNVIVVPEKIVPVKQRSTKLAETHDAHTLIEGVGTPIERVYADHSNRLKALADSARKEAVHTEHLAYSPSAAKTYSKEVERLNAALRIAKANAPKERQAQVLANHWVALKKEAYPDMEKTELKRVESQALEEARIRSGVQKTRIEISEHEWAAIQAGAIRPSPLKEILDKANLDTVKKLATPREAVKMTDIKTARAKQMIASGFTQAEIADALGVSVSTIQSTVKGSDTNG